MLIEAVLAVVALITAVTILQGDYSQLVTAKGGGPIGIFSAGVGKFMASFGIPIKAGVTFSALAISAFAMTTLDTATRLGRFAFQEFFESERKKTWLGSNRYPATLITIFCAMLLTFSGSSDVLWPLFGSANQLLASLALLAIMVWLAKMRKKNAFVRYPMYFMFIVTLSALGNLIYKNIVARNYILIFFAVVLFVVAMVLVIEARKSLRGISGQEA
jgi:carbon starvation protein